MASLLGNWLSRPAFLSPVRSRILTRDQLVRVRLKRPRSENAVPSLKQIVTMKLKFERILVSPGQVLMQILTFNIQ
jgi:hypothetical protein